jgi:hypothetical protein
MAAAAALGKRVWLLLWGKCVWLLLLKCRLLVTVSYRKWKIRLCQEIRTQYQRHDDPNTGSHLVVLWRIADFIRTDSERCT